MQPWLLTRKLTDPPSAWDASDDPIMGSGGHRHKLTTWREQWGSTIRSAFPVGSEITSDQMRDGWFEVLKEALKTETGSDGIFKDQTITLKLIGPDQTSSGRTVSGTQGLFEAATRSTKVKTFSGGVEVQPSQGTTGAGIGFAVVLVVFAGKRSFIQSEAGLQRFGRPPLSICSLCFVLVMYKYCSVRSILCVWPLGTEVWTTLHL
jgi:hypothetical protein